MLKLIIFDFDGTLVDINPLIKVIGEKITKRFGLPPLTEEKIEKARNMTAEEIIKTFHVPFWMIPALIAYAKYHQRNMIDQIKAIHGIKNILTSLKKDNYQLGIITSNDKPTVEKFLKNNNMEMFEFIHSQLNLFGKASSIRTVLEKNKLKHKEVIYIGDEVRDIKACKAARIKIISVTWGFNGYKILKKTNADFIVDKPHEILEVVEKLELTK
jgi:phosphoglycolate phosphatase